MQPYSPWHDMTDNTKFIGPFYFKFIGPVYFLLWQNWKKLKKMKTLREKMKTMKIPDFEKMFQISGVYHRNTRTGGVSA